MSTLGTWDEEAPLADERFLRRRTITKGFEKNYIPRNKRKAVPILTGPLTKKQLQNWATHITKAYKDAKKRYQQSDRTKESRNKRSRKSYQTVKASLQEEKKSLTEGKKEALPSNSGRSLLIISLVSLLAAEVDACFSCRPMSPVECYQMI
jgi:hypothetical protein